MRFRKFASACCLTLAGAALVSAQAPTGAPVQPTGKEQKALDAIKGTIKGKIVWSSSRSNSKHDIWIMNADGSDQKQLTKSDNVDWFSRISPDGSRVVFTRSKMGWVNEMDAEMYDKWDIWTINIDGTDEKKVAEDAAWGNWRPSGDSIVFARGSKVFIKSLDDGGETMIFDAEVSLKRGAYSQQPELSPNGRFLAITVRGSDRQTGVWDRQNNSWTTFGAGCQISWFPTSDRVIRMNEGAGNGGTEVLSFNVTPDGKPVQPVRGLSVPKEVRLMDLPGRRSHEYFPKISPDGKYMVWCATQYGHEHDIYDYEVFIFELSKDKKKDFVRLTFHSGNDRWPDIFIGETR